MTSPAQAEILDYASFYRVAQKDLIEFILKLDHFTRNFPVAVNISAEPIFSERRDQVTSFSVSAKCPRLPAELATRLGEFSKVVEDKLIRS